MGRKPCCDKGVRKGAWTPEEDEILVDYITKNGHGTWRSLPKNAGLLRCGKSCRLRWTNYLRPDIKRGPFTSEEENTIIHLHGLLGNKWASIATHLAGRTDNEVKNFWNTHLRKRVPNIGLNLQTLNSSVSSEAIVKSESPSTSHRWQWESARVEAEAHFSTNSLLPCPSAENKPYRDYFLKLWNSEVGESFRKIKNGDEVASQLSKLETSSSAKVESESAVTVQAVVGGWDPSSSDMATNEKVTSVSSEKNETDMMVGTDSSNSFELDSCSDAALKLLLDIPGGNFMDFLQEETDDISFYLQH